MYNTELTDVLSFQLCTRVDSFVECKTSNVSKKEYFALVLKSSNKKTGKIPVSISSRTTCPSVCPFIKNGCYADSGGPLLLYWSKISRGLHTCSFDEFVYKIKSLSNDILWRHNQAGDLSGNDNSIHTENMLKLVEANRGKRGFTYTHKPVISHEYAQSNLEKITYMNRHGFTVNVSANSLAHLDELYENYIDEFAPISVVLSYHYKDAKRVYTHNGHKVIVCPAFYNDTITCKTCGLCQKYPRDYAIGFPAHGTGYKKASYVADSIN